MAILILANATTDAGRTQLGVAERVLGWREWLNREWAILLSHPDDFAPHPSTPAGFITCIAEQLRAARIKPIVLARSFELPASNWLDHAINDDAVVVLDSRARVVDLSAGALVKRLERLTGRFALIVDERGRCRATINYQQYDRSARTLANLVERISVLRGEARPASGTGGRRSFGE